MLAHQQSLPRLPVPRLEDTHARFLRSARPLLTDEEYARTERIAAEFFGPSGRAQHLQQRLTQRAEEKKDSSWLSEWWLNCAYLVPRCPVVVYVSYFYQFIDDPRPQFSTQTGRAASLITAALKFRDMVVRNELEPEFMGRGDKKEPLCMDMYQYMFNSCRIPALGKDSYECYDPQANTHIIVARKNRFYELPTVFGGRQLSTMELDILLQRIVEDAGEARAPPVGILTADDRDQWAKNRELLLSARPLHKTSLERIQRGVFLVALDDTAPTTADEMARNLWHGNGENRFFDKSLQFVVTENGKAGMIGEHTAMDGMPTQRCVDWMLTSLFKNKIDHGDSCAPAAHLPSPSRITFDVAAAPLLAAVQSAAERFFQLATAHDLSCLEFKEYGRDAVKGFGFSPDAWCQMAIQLAYYQQFGRVVATYETGHTRRFLHGRTATIRSCSIESTQWVKSMQDASVPAATRHAQLQAAAKRHTRTTVEAMNGQDVDRHLLGLRLSLQPGEEMPEFFKDAGFTRSCYWAISTSTLVSPYFQNWGWGEVVPDGLGIAYMALPRSLVFNLSSMNMGTRRMREALCKALRDMRALCEEVSEKDPRAKL